MTAKAFRVSEAAALLGVSDDTIRRWVDAGRLTLIPGTSGTAGTAGTAETSGTAGTAGTAGKAGPQSVDAAGLAAVAQELAAESALATAFPATRASARNRLTGIVTKVTKDGLMAQVELQAGPFRIVSLMSREAAEELELEPGSLAVASVKATTVVIEVPE
jgi:molybdopterin-binding protein